MGPASAMMSAKAEEIRRLLSDPVVDLWKLREMALTEGGLVNGQFAVWLLLSLDDASALVPFSHSFIGATLTIHDHCYTQTPCVNWHGPN